MTRLGAAIAALLATAANPAAAHGGLGGGGGFLSGVFHPFMAIEHLILLLGLGLLSARVPRERRGPSFALLGVGLLLGVAVAHITPGVAVTVAILGLAVVTGGFVSLAPQKLSAVLLAGLAGLSGLAVGLDTDTITGWQNGLPALATSTAGLATGVYLIVLDAAALASLAARPPFPIAVRVAGSWIAAIGLMLLALSLAPIRAAA